MSDGEHIVTERRAVDSNMICLRVAGWLKPDPNRPGFYGNADVAVDALGRAYLDAIRRLAALEIVLQSHNSEQVCDLINKYNSDKPLDSMKCVL